MAESLIMPMSTMELNPRGNTRGPSLELQIDASIRHGVASALRKRAARQAAIAQASVVMTESGVPVRTGESAIASRLAEALAAAAHARRWATLDDYRAIFDRALAQVRAATERASEKAARRPAGSAMNETLEVGRRARGED
jgi:hypothetical protein